MKFEELEINEKLLEKTRECGFKELTYIQEKCIGEICNGRDMVGQAETGSGKTLAFGLPLLNKIVPGGGLQALILTPTRELCVQVTEVFQDFGRSLDIKTTGIFGGVSIEPQIKNIRTSNVIVGTPGRILDHLNRNTLNLSNIKFLVLDETDRMLDMGFIDDVEIIIQKTPEKRQTLMFSATIGEEIDYIMRKHLRNPLIIKTQPYVDANKLSQVFYDISQHNLKFSLLVHLLKNSTPGLAIVFCGTRRESDIVATNLRNQGIHASAIHGGMDQHMRLNALNAVKNKKADVLVATDVAARGLDIKNVTHVYNYDVPKTSKEYVHRIGRTARAGTDGNAVTLLTERDHDNFRQVQKGYTPKINRVDMPRFLRVSFVRSAGRNTSFKGDNKYSTHRNRRGEPRERYNHRWQS